MPGLREIVSRSGWHSLMLLMEQKKGGTASDYDVLLICRCSWRLL
jgi:hypothetical protein